MLKKLSTDSALNICTTTLRKSSVDGLMIGAAKATYVQAWEEKMKQIKDINVAAHDLLMAVPKKS